MALRISYGLFFVTELIIYVVYCERLRMWSVDLLRKFLCYEYDSLVNRFFLLATAQWVILVEKQCFNTIIKQWAGIPNNNYKHLLFFKCQLFSFFLLA